jgi:uncharacterized protein (TIRG00374 family)
MKRSNLSQESGFALVRSLSKGQSALLALKLTVTLACFWYLFQHIDVAELRRSLPDLHVPWAVLAVLLLAIQMPLVGLRWLQIARLMEMRGRQLTVPWMSVAAAIGIFFNQIMPVVAGDGVRVWFLAHFGNDWRDAAISVAIDRSVGIGLLLTFTLAIMLLPSSLGIFGNARGEIVLALIIIIVVGLVCLLISARVATALAGWRYGRWIERFVRGARATVIGPRSTIILSIGCFIHMLTIVAVWSLGRAQGLALSPADAAVLFSVMIGVALVPFTIGGWGLRELAMVSLFGNYGLTPERALVFSMYFGLAAILASLPGAVAWLGFILAPARGFTWRHPRT